MGWAIVVARLGGDLEAEAGLDRAGFAVYLPRYRRILRGVRIAPDGRRTRTRGQGSAVLRPLISPYLFAELAPGHSLDQWLSDVLNVRGVAGVLRYRTGLPAVVAEEAMAKFRADVQSGIYNVDLVPGDRVSIGAGAWAGHSGRVIELTDRGLTYLEVEIFGRLVPVEVSSDVPLGVII